MSLRKESQSKMSATPVTPKVPATPLPWTSSLAAPPVALTYQVRRFSYGHNSYACTVYLFRSTVYRIRTEYSHTLFYLFQNQTARSGICEGCFLRYVPNTLKKGYSALSKKSEPSIGASLLLLTDEETEASKQEWLKESAEIVPITAVDDEYDDEDDEEDNSEDVMLVVDGKRLRLYDILTVAERSHNDLLKMGCLMSKRMQQRHQVPQPSDSERDAGKSTGKGGTNMGTSQQGNTSASATDNSNREAASDDENFKDSFRTLRRMISVLPVGVSKLSLRSICIHVIQNAMTHAPPVILAFNKLRIFGVVLRSIFSIAEIALLCSPPLVSLSRGGYEIDLFMESLSDGLLSLMFDPEEGSHLISPEKLFAYLRVKTYVLYHYLKSNRLRRLCRELLSGVSQASTLREEIIKKKELLAKREESSSNSFGSKMNNFKIYRKSDKKGKGKFFRDTVFTVQERNLLFGFQVLFMLATHPRSTREGRLLSNSVSKGINQNEVISDMKMSAGDCIDSLLNGIVSVSALPTLITLDLLRRVLDSDASRFKLMDLVAQRDMNVKDLFFLANGGDPMNSGFPDGTTSWHDEAEMRLNDLCYKLLNIIDANGVGFLNDHLIDESVLRRHIADIRDAASKRDEEGKKMVEKLITIFKPTLDSVMKTKRLAATAVEAFVRPWTEKLGWLTRELNKLNDERNYLLDRLASLAEDIQSVRKSMNEIAAYLVSIKKGELTIIPPELEAFVLEPGEDNGTERLKHAQFRCEQVLSQIEGWKSEWQHLHRRQLELKHMINPTKDTFMELSSEDVIQLHSKNPLIKFDGVDERRSSLPEALVARSLMKESSAQGGGRSGRISALTRKSLFMSYLARENDGVSFQQDLASLTISGSSKQKNEPKHDVAVRPASQGVIDRIHSSTELELSVGTGTKGLVMSTQTRKKKLRLDDRRALSAGDNLTPTSRRRYLERIIRTQRGGSQVQEVDQQRPHVDLFGDSSDVNTMSSQDLQDTFSVTDAMENNSVTSTLSGITAWFATSMTVYIFTLPFIPTSVIIPIVCITLLQTS